MEDIIDIELAFNVALRFRDSHKDLYVKSTRPANALDGLYDGGFKRWVHVPSLYRDTLFDRLNLLQVDVIAELRSGRLVGIEEKVSNRPIVVPGTSTPGLLLETCHVTKGGAFLKHGSFLLPRHPSSRVYAQCDTPNAQATFWDRNALDDARNWALPPDVPMDVDRGQDIATHDALGTYRRRTRLNAGYDTEFIVAPQTWVRSCLLTRCAF